MPNYQGPPPSQEDFAAALQRQQLESSFGQSTKTRFKDQNKIGDGTPEHEKKIIVTSTGAPHIAQEHTLTKLACGHVKPESEIGGMCHCKISRKELCNRYICKECASLIKCFDCGSMLCASHKLPVRNSYEETFYYCVRCAEKRARKSFLKGLFEFILSPFMVKEKIR